MKNPEYTPLTEEQESFLTHATASPQEILEGFEEETRQKDIELLIELLSHAEKRECANDNELLAHDQTIIEAYLCYKDDPQKLLTALGCREGDIARVGKDLYRINITDLGPFDALPHGYGYKGGVARALLARTLGIDPQAQARDVDLVKLSRNIDPLEEKRLAQYYAPDESSSKTEVLDPKRYFSTRDFTINEVLVVDRTLYLSVACLLDTARRIIRLTEFEKRELHNNNPWYDTEGAYFVKGKLLAKMARMAAEAVTVGRRITIADPEAYQFNSIRPFDLAVHLDRALAQGYHVAVKYVAALMRTGDLQTEKPMSPEQALLYFIHQIQSSDTGFIFQHAPQITYDRQADIIELASYEKRFLAEEKYGDIAESFSASHT